MEFTSRLKQILLILLKENEAISVVKLSDSIKVSKRTIQRELEYLPKALKAYNLKFASKTGVGIWIEGEDSAKFALLNLLEDENTPDVSDREYRRKSLILELLKEKGLKKLYWYSSKFKVSEATISTDLEYLDNWFSLHNLKIIRKPGSGISVEGSEEDYRKAISTFVSENINDEIVKDIYSANIENVSLYEKIKKSGLTQMISEDILKRVITCINQIQSEQIHSLTENSYMGLALHIAIAINRIIQKESIDANTYDIKTFLTDEDYNLSKNLARELEDEFDIEIAKNEIKYICLHIKASKHDKINIENNKYLELSGENLKLLINEMIYAFNPEQAYLLKQDEEFLQGLLVHLQPTIIRLSHNMKIYNPVLQEIKAQYSNIFDNCKAVASVLEKHFSVIVPEEEIGFIAVHFGAALVRLEEKRESRRVVNVGVVCSSGIGISRLMSSKLKKVFKDRINLNAYSKRDLNQKVLDDLDFIITSISLDCRNTEIIVVNPLLNEDDLIRINQSISKYEQIPHKNYTPKKNDLDLEKILFIVTQIKNSVDDFKLVRLEKDTSFELMMNKISTILEKETESQLQIKEDIIAREKLSTQIFPEFKFALFHAKTTGVKNPKLAVFLSEDLGEFSHKSLGRIKIAFVMLIPKDENIGVNSKILGHMSSSIIEEDNLLNIILSGDVSIVKAKLNEIYKNYLRKTLG